MFDLRIIDRDMSTFREEVADEGNCGRFAGVTRVSFEGKAKNSDVLSNRSKNGIYYFLSKGIENTLLVIVLKSVSTTRLEKRRF